MAGYWIVSPKEWTGLNKVWLDFINTPEDVIHVPCGLNEQQSDRFVGFLMGLYTNAMSTLQAMSLALKVYMDRNFAADQVYIFGPHDDQLSTNYLKFSKNAFER
jgi:hypothetical protein